MFDEEELVLFGSASGRVEWATMTLRLPTADAGMTIEMLCQPTMRKKIMRIVIELHCEGDVPKALGFCAQFLHRAPYCQDKWLMHYWWRLQEDLIAEGYDASITNSGRNPLFNR